MFLRIQNNLILEFDNEHIATVLETMQITRNHIHFTMVLFETISLIRTPETNKLMYMLRYLFC